jgi:hypothetical protein
MKRMIGRENQALLGALIKTYFALMTNGGVSNGS